VLKRYGCLAIALLTLAGCSPLSGLHGLDFYDGLVRPIVTGEDPDAASRKRAKRDESDSGDHVKNADRLADR
jgi:hypothetical protein